ncbi:hypothetical protein [Bradyrhizobium sp. Arg816]|uniref:hypothetical protein n=1 Tax=Bradyrhizobium sp. Arg816 TaxID=2998491 RepID=UPI00249F4A37|nr:hypothetical protein [Bradyrhizobium sp. Arg816]MDI3559997.1 hypothetical protein [Bradyrhizobium sp. Arg816]
MRYIVVSYPQMLSKTLEVIHGQLLLFPARPDEPSFDHTNAGEIIEVAPGGALCKLSWCVHDRAPALGAF